MRRVTIALQSDSSLSRNTCVVYHLDAPGGAATCLQILPVATHSSPSTAVPQEIHNTLHVLALYVFLLYFQFVLVHVPGQKWPRNLRNNTEPPSREYYLSQFSRFGCNLAGNPVFQRNFHIPSKNLALESNG